MSDWIVGSNYPVINYPARLNLSHWVRLIIFSCDQQQTISGSTLGGIVLEGIGDSSILSQLVF